MRSSASISAMKWVIPGSPAVCSASNARIVRPAPTGSTPSKGPVGLVCPSKLTASGHSGCSEAHRAATMPPSGGARPRRDAPSRGHRSPHPRTRRLQPKTTSLDPATRPPPCVAPLPPATAQQAASPWTSAHRRAREESPSRGTLPALRPPFRPSAAAGRDVVATGITSPIRGRGGGLQERRIADLGASGLEPFVEGSVAGGELSVRVAELERRQKRNCGNSSVPPSNGPDGPLILDDVRAKPVPFRSSEGDPASIRRPLQSRFPRKRKRAAQAARFRKHLKRNGLRPYVLTPTAPRRRTTHQRGRPRRRPTPWLSALARRAAEALLRQVRPAEATRRSCWSPPASADSSRAAFWTDRSTETGRPLT